jgi:hypothetical protein
MKYLLSLVLLAAMASTVNAAEAPVHGEFSSEGEPRVWHESENAWLTPNTFWGRFAEARGGITWGSRDTYPNYDDVNEHDTLLINISSGSCLMEFFHSRWRRANDVQRWNPLFNEYGGCPDVFK